MHGQGHHRPPRGGERPVVTHGAQRPQQGEPLLPCPRRWRIREGEVLDRRPPHRHLERQAGEIDRGDLGGAVRRPAAVLDLRPQPVGDAWLRAPGSTGALVGRVAADRHRGQARHPGGRVEPWRSGKPAVDDDPDPLDRERGLGDVGRQDDAPPAGWRRGEGEVLLLSAHRPGERAYVDHVADDADESVAAAHDLADAGEKHEDVAVILCQRPDDRSFDGVLEAVLALPRQPADVHRVCPSGDLDDRRRIGSDAGEEASEARRVSGGRHRQNAQVGPQRRGHVEGQRQAEVRRQVALVNLVEDHGGDARQLRVALQAPSQHAFGQHLDARRRADHPFVAGLVADQFAHPLPGDVGHPPSGRPRRQPPRLEDHDLVVAAPRHTEQRERHDRRLAGAWRRRHHRTSIVGECPDDRLEPGADREVGKLHLGPRQGTFAWWRRRWVRSALKSRYAAVGGFGGR